MDDLDAEWIGSNAGMYAPYLVLQHCRKQIIDRGMMHRDKQIISTAMHQRKSSMVLIDIRPR